MPRNRRTRLGLTAASISFEWFQASFEVAAQLKELSRCALVALRQNEGAGSSKKRGAGIFLKRAGLVVAHKQPGIVRRHGMLAETARLIGAQRRAAP